MDFLQHFDPMISGDPSLDKSPSSEDTIDIENESPNDDKSNRFETFENSNDFWNFLSGNMTGEDQEITDEINPDYQENNETLIYYACAMCPANFEKKSSLFGHFTAMHEKTKKLDCEICNSHFQIESSLKRHMNLVHEELRSFVCILCEQSFGKKDQLKVHIKKVHGTTQNYNCEICNSHFRFENKFKSHMKIVHQNLKPFSCKSCMATFGQINALKCHIKFACKFGHETMKPFDCSGCDMKFNFKVELESHMKNVHPKLKPHGCKECKRKYRTKLSLQKHIKNVHQKKAHEGKELDSLEQLSYDNHITCTQENNTSLEMNLAETSLQPSSILACEEIEKNENVHQDWKQFLLD